MNSLNMKNQRFLTTGADFTLPLVGHVDILDNKMLRGYFEPLPAVLMFMESTEGITGSLIAEGLGLVRHITLHDTT